MSLIDSILYVVVFLVSVLAIRMYFRIANHFNIIDKPNQRSSHLIPVIRGGGIIFPISIISWYFLFGLSNTWFFLGLLAISIISFLDDVFTLRNLIRILVHLIAVSLLIFELELFSGSWYIIPILFVLIIGWINAFNFMDGINGISVLYSLSFMMTILALPASHLEHTPFSLLMISSISLLIFAFYNVRSRARTFAGDVGSVSLAFLMAFILLDLIVTTGQYQYILFFSVYGIDSVVTIVHRIVKSENIFQAHRSHLYQFLANEKKMPHVWVAVGFALAQLIINFLTILILSMSSMSIYLFVSILVALSAIYLSLRVYILHSLSRPVNVT